MSVDGVLGATTIETRTACFGVGRTRLALALSTLALLAALPVRGGEGALTFKLGRSGIISLKYDGQEYAARSDLQVNRVQMRRWDGTEFAADAKESRRDLDLDLNLLMLDYSWGLVTCMFAVEGDRLGLTIEVSNHSDTTISDIEMTLGVTNFGTTPEGWVAHMPYRNFNLGWPTINVADCGKTVIAVCNEDVGRPLMLGWRGDQSTTRRSIVLGTSSDWMQDMLNPMMYRPIHPNGTDKYEMTIRFAGRGGATKIAADLRKRFAEEHEFKLKWDDRRPIGALHLSTSKAGRAKNPRGWFNGKDADFVSAEGRAAFKQELLAYAHNCVEVLKSFNAQGMITWDVEGQEYPHATSYLGDPRSLPPEIEPVADEYFRIFRDAGLKTGLTLRPQIPVRAAYGEGVWQTPGYDPLEILDAKVAYAKKRWGCSIFYIDSNGDPNIPFDASIFSKLGAKHPDVLLIPEHENAQYYTSGAPYRCYGNLKQMGTPEAVREIYPNAFSCLAVAHADPASVTDEMVKYVRRGDIIIVNAWYPWDGLKSVMRIYERAGR